ncbi:hypothetical protein [Streptomyces tubercidicus]
MADKHGPLPAVEPEAGAVWSHRCRWDDLLVRVSVVSGRRDLDLSDGWTGLWSVSLNRASIRGQHGAASRLHS